MNSLTKQVTIQHLVHATHKDPLQEVIHALDCIFFYVSKE